MADSMCQRSKEAHLQYTIKIGFIFVLSTLDGMVESSYGPSVKDYQCIFQETRQRISLLFPIYSTFNAIGTLMFFLIRQWFDPYFVATVYMIITCLLLVSLPLLPFLWLALLLTAVIGWASGVATHARLAETGILAEKSPVSLHLFSLGACAGAIIGPLLITRFLGEIPTNDTLSLLCACNDCGTGNASNFGNKSCHNNEHGCDGFQSNIIFGFVIFAVIGGICFLGYITLHKLLQSDKYKDVKREDKNSKATGTLDIIFLLLLASMVLTAGPTNFVYGNLLSTFGINSSLKTSPRLMSLITSSFFACTLIGRIVGTCMSLVVSQRVLLTVCLIGSVGTATGLVFLAEISIATLWVSSSVFALLFSPIFAAVTAWSETVCRVKHVLYLIWVGWH